MKKEIVIRTIALQRGRLCFLDKEGKIVKSALLSRVGDMLKFSQFLAEEFSDGKIRGEYDEERQKVLLYPQV